MDIELRDFTKNDIAIYEQLHKEINASQYMSRAYPKDYGKENSEYYFKAILLNNHFIGIIYFEPDFDQQKSYYLGIMIGRNKLFGKGIGKLAIKKGIELLQKETVVETVKLNVRANNERAVNCYKNFGFKTTQTYYKTADSNNIKCYSMKYEIKN